MDIKPQKNTKSIKRNQEERESVWPCVLTGRLSLVYSERITLAIYSVEQNNWWEWDEAFQWIASSESTQLYPRQNTTFIIDHHSKKVQFWSCEYKLVERRKDMGNLLEFGNDYILFQLKSDMICVWIRK